MREGSRFIGYPAASRSVAFKKRAPMKQVLTVYVVLLGGVALIAFAVSSIF